MHVVIAVGTKFVGRAIHSHHRPDMRLVQSLSGCSKAGSVVSSAARGSWFESNHRVLFNRTLLLSLN